MAMERGMRRGNFEKGNPTVLSQIEGCGEGNGGPIKTHFGWIYLLREHYGCSLVLPCVSFLS